MKKSYWDASTFEVRDREPHDYVTLPTYHHGTSQIRLILRMFEAGKGDLVWAAAGTIHAQSGSHEEYARKLAERLLKELPSISPRTNN